MWLRLMADAGCAAVDAAAETDGSGGIRRPTVFCANLAAEDERMQTSTSDCYGLLKLLTIDN
jgi:hypothetical protein